MSLSPPPAKLSDGSVSIGRRPLTDAERAGLRKRYARRRRMKAVWWVLVVLIPFYCVGVLAYTPMGSSLGLILMFGSMIGVGLLIVMANDALQRVSVAAMEAATEVERFEHPNGGGLSEVVVGSGDVLMRGGSPVTQYRRMHIFTPPAQSTKVAGPGRDRDLTPEEIGEIENIALANRIAQRKEIWLSAPLLAIGPIFIFSPKTNALYIAFGLLMVGARAASIISAVKALRLAKRMEEDAREGKVRGIGVAEVLPNSDMTWTSGGEPAAWRSSHLPKS